MKTTITQKHIVDVRLEHSIIKIEVNHTEIKIIFIQRWFPSVGDKYFTVYINNGFRIQFIHLINTIQQVKIALKNGK